MAQPSAFNLTVPSIWPRAPCYCRRPGRSLRSACVEAPSSENTFRDSFERIHDEDSVEILTCLQIFGEELRTLGTLGGGDHQGIPEGQPKPEEDGTSPLRKRQTISARSSARCQAIQCSPPETTTSSEEGTSSWSRSA